MPTATEILEQPPRPNAPRRIVATAPSYAEAVELAGELFAIAHFDHYADYEGCADFITEGGTLYWIQPEGFTLAQSAAA